MYWTQRFSRASGGRYDMRMYFPIDGPMPAEVTYERRPFASTIGDPSARTIGSRPSGVRDNSSIRRVPSVAPRPPPPGRGGGARPPERPPLHLPPHPPAPRMLE